MTLAMQHRWIHNWMEYFDYKLVEGDTWIHSNGYESIRKMMRQSIGAKVNIIPETIFKLMLKYLFIMNWKFYLTWTDDLSRKTYIWRIDIKINSFWRMEECNGETEYDDLAWRHQPPVTRVHHLNFPVHLFF